ncbi:MAG: gliding motility-associated protein GldE [Saprospiraceae bacterium]|nr:gliding motility-associated protein GldE [Saprospiraceae bacterium]
METEPPNLFLGFIHCFILIDWSFLAYLLLLIVLICCSGLISASEVAFFSLTSSKIRSLEEEDSGLNHRIIQLRNQPQKLLATILIGNNFVNIAIVIVSQILLSRLLHESVLSAIGWWLHDYIFLGLFTPDQLATSFNFFITVILVTFMLLLFGEVGPKIYANVNNMRVARIMATPLSLMGFLFTPVSSVLVGWGSRIENKISASRNYQTGTSREDLDAAIELTVSQNEEEPHEAELLKGIVKFGDMSARQVMKPRIDVVAVEKETGFEDLLKIVNESGYSRLPIYDEDFDNILGILYVKDLVGHTRELDGFDWNSLIRTNMLYIPETKKIDDLLRDFQIKRLHMAIVVDEFGGTLGIVTLEDIMEEVIGEIKDEFDDEEDVEYIKLGEGNYIFEGKSLLNDVCRVIGEKTSYFDDIKGNADSVGGLIIELFGFIPKPEKELTIKDLKMKVISSNSRRIEKVNIKLQKSDA